MQASFGYSKSTMIEDGHLVGGELLLAKPHREVDPASMIRAALACTRKANSDPHDAVARCSSEARAASRCRGFRADARARKQRKKAPFLSVRLIPQ
jgi:hypothetical protein